MNLKTKTQNKPTNQTNNKTGVMVLAFKPNSLVYIGSSKRARDIERNPINTPTSERKKKKKSAKFLTLDSALFPLL